MAKSKVQQKDLGLRSFRKGNLGATIVFSILTIIFGIVFVALLIGAFVGYAIDTKVAKEQENIQSIAGLYENGILEKAANTAFFDELSLPDRNIVVKDSLENVIYIQGEDTIGEKTAVLDVSDRHLTNLSVDTTVYLDTDEKYTNRIVDKDGVIRRLNFASLIIRLAEYKHINKQDTHFDISLPFWMRVDVSEGSSVYGRMIIRFSPKDLLAMLLFGLGMSLLIFTVIALMLINAISNLVSHTRMTRLFFKDPVTKKSNWMFFLFKGEAFLRRGKAAPLTCALVNYSLIKFANFCVCHSVEEGDEILCKTDKVIRERLHRGEICAKHGTSDFAVMLFANSEDEIKKRVEEILESLKGIDHVHKFAFHAGAVILPPVKNASGKIIKRKELDIEKEFNNACTATNTLSESDDSGIAYFDDKLVEEQKWMDIVNEKQQSALDNEEFVVFYQPKYDPRTDELKGAEALIRWDSPEYGFKSPGTIIPIFEKNGFITEIDHYMIRHVAIDQKKWLDQGLKCVPVSVNVSRAHFIEPDLAEQIRDEIDAVGIPRNLIEIELTESAFFDDKKAIVDTIRKLKGFGFIVSMDDFGSGYSSLNSLKDMPLDVLKLDAEFFRGEAEEDRGEIVVSEAIKLAKSLHMQTVAEGVEIKEQVDFLARQGCDMIQGYYYAKPMPGDEYMTKMDGYAKSAEENQE